MADQKCSIQGCESKAQRKGLCRKHYDEERGQGGQNEEAGDAKPQTQRPFIGFENPYKPNSGYSFLFEIIRINPPLTAQETIDKTKAAMAKAGKPDYRCDCAFAVVASKRHRSKRPGYHMVQREDGRWELVQGDYDK